MTARRINRKSLTEQIAEDIATQISRETLEPNAELPSEQELGRTYEVSRPVIREALRRLEARGYVVISNGRRARVKEIGSDLLNAFLERVMSQDEKSWRELIDVREALESVAVRDVARDASGEAVGELREIVERMARSFEDPVAYSKADLEFHLALARASGNRLLTYFIEATRTALVSTMRTLRTRISPEYLPAVQRSHEAIIEAVAANDVEGARGALATHFETVRQQLNSENSYGEEEQNED